MEQRGTFFRGRSAAERIEGLCIALFLTMIWAKGAEPETIDAARELAKELGTTSVKHVYSNIVATYSRVEGNTFRPVDLSIDYTMETTGEGGAVEPSEPPESKGSKKDSYRIKLIHHEGVLYLSETMVQDLKRDGTRIAERRGTYVADILEGSWEGYLKGEPFEFRYSAESTERAAFEIEKKFNTREYVVSTAEFIRDNLRDLHRNKPDHLPAGITREASLLWKRPEVREYFIENTWIWVEWVDVKGDASVFRIEGDEMVRKADEESKTVRYWFAVK